MRGWAVAPSLLMKSPECDTRHLDGTTERTAQRRGRAMSSTAPVPAPVPGLVGGELWSILSMSDTIL